MPDPRSDILLLKKGMRDRTRQTAFRAILRVYVTVGLLVAAGALGYYAAKTLSIDLKKSDALPLIAGAVGLMTALVSHLTIRLLSERDNLRAALYVDAHVFMRILADWTRFEELASLLMDVDTEKRPVSARYLVQGLVERGILNPDDAEKLDAALMVRNAIAHGRLSLLGRAEAEIAASQLSRIVATLARVAGVARSSARANLEPPLPTFGEA